MLFFITKVERDGIELKYSFLCFLIGARKGYSQSRESESDIGITYLISF
jgi:hypothetical protein